MSYIRRFVIIRGCSDVYFGTFYSPAFVGGGIIICSPRNHKVCVRGGTSDTETTAASTNSQGGVSIGPTSQANTAFGSWAILLRYCLRVSGAFSAFMKEDSGSLSSLNSMKCHILIFCVGLNKASRL